MNVQPWLVSIAVAVVSVIVVPTVVGIVRHYMAMRRERHALKLDARVNEFLKGYVTTGEHEMQFETLTRTQAQQHKENRDFLDTIRSEAHQREGKILGSLEAVSSQHRAESQRLGTDIARVGARVDTLFERLAEVKRK